MRRAVVFSGVLIALVMGAIAVRPVRQSIEWEWVRSTQKPDQLRWFIAASPDSSHTEQARQLLDSIEWASARNSGDAERVRAYLSSHPDGVFVHEANVLLEGMVWKQAEQSHRQESYQEYLRRWPNGEHVAAAKDKLEMMRKASLLSDEERSVVAKECNSLKQTNELLTKQIGKCVEVLGLPTCTGGPLSGTFTRYASLSVFVGAAGDFAGGLGGGNILSNYTSARNELEKAGVLSLVKQESEANSGIKAAVKQAEIRSKESFGNVDAVCSVFSTEDGSAVR
jgi:hypothetical protein